MIEWHKVTLLLTLLTASCACQPSTTDFHSDPETEFELAWLLGCWVSENGDTKESWQRSREGSQLFGYSVTRGTALFRTAPFGPGNVGMEPFCLSSRHRPDTFRWRQ